MASTTSSAASFISVAFDGKVMSLEEALDENFRQIQKMLTGLHVKMRQLAALTEQEIDEDEDFRESVLFEDDAFDFVTGMVRLLEEIPLMARTITGTAPAECKEWYTAHKAARKAKLTQEKVEHKAASDKAKLDLKLLMKSGAPQESKTG